MRRDAEPVEAAWLLGEARGGQEVAWALQSARRLIQAGFGGVVVKGGHRLRGAVDVAQAGSRVERLTGARLRRQAGHRGTGCRFASALATELGRGTTAERAVATARLLVRRTFRRPREPGA